MWVRHFGEVMVINGDHDQDERNKAIGCMFSVLGGGTADWARRSLETRLPEGFIVNGRENGLKRALPKTKRINCVARESKARSSTNCWPENNCHEACFTCTHTSAGRFEQVNSKREKAHRKGERSSFAPAITRQRAEAGKQRSSMAKKRLSKRAAQTASSKPSASAINKEAHASRRSTRRKLQMRKTKRAILLTTLSQQRQQRQRDSAAQQRGGVFAHLQHDLRAALERGETAGEAAGEAGGDSGARGAKGQVSARGRRALAGREGAHLARVRDHPAFRENPMEALRLHLSNSVCADAMEVAPGDTVLATAPRRRREAGAHVAGGDGAVRQARARAREAVLKKRGARLQVAQMIREARKARREQDSVGKQSAQSLLGGRGAATHKERRYGSGNTQRGRIGQKRAKI